MSFAFAYYVAGYAVECGLKACVLAQMVHTGRVFKEPTKDKDNYLIHDLVKLVGLAGLADTLNDYMRLNTTFAGNWGVVKDWDETSRYKDRSEADARALLDAIVHDPSGVMAWIRKHW